MELVIRLALIALGIFIIVVANDFPRWGEYPGPGFFPQLLGVALATSGLLLTAQAVIRRSWPRPSLSLFFSQDFLNALVTVGAVIFYLYISDRLGFLPTAFLVVSGLMLLLGVRWWWSALLAFVIAGLTFLLFHRLLLVPLPYGPIEKWLQPFLFGVYGV